MSKLLKWTDGHAFCRYRRGWTVKNCKDRSGHFWLSTSENCDDFVRIFRTWTAWTYVFSSPHLIGSVMQKIMLASSPLLTHLLSHFSALEWCVLCLWHNCLLWSWISADFSQWTCLTDKSVFSCLSYLVFNPKCSCQYRPQGTSVLRIATHQKSHCQWTILVFCLYIQQWETRTDKILQLERFCWVVHHLVIWESLCSSLDGSRFKAVNQLLPETLPVVCSRSLTFRTLVILAQVLPQLGKSPFNFWISILKGSIFMHSYE